MPKQCPAVIDAIQPDRIEREMAVNSETIPQRLAVHEIDGWNLKQLGHELRQGLRIPTVPGAVALQREGRDKDSAPSLRLCG